jgi:hypothetical protein
MVKYLDGISETEIVGINIANGQPPTGQPLVYELDASPEGGAPLLPGALSPDLHRPTRANAVSAARISIGIEDVYGSKTENCGMGRPWAYWRVRWRRFSHETVARSSVAPLPLEELQQTIGRIRPDQKRLPGGASRR